MKNNGVLNIPTGMKVIIMSDIHTATGTVVDDLIKKSLLMTKLL
jgi:hypothetical protein